MSKKQKFMAEFEKAWLVAKPHFKSLKLTEDERLVIATTDNDCEYKVNVEGDSVDAIMVDVCNHLGYK